MRRLQRAIIAILCVVCLAFGVFACGDPNDNGGAEATYTITVTGGSSLELRTASVKLKNEDGDDATSAKPLRLNKEATAGTATFKLKAGKYTVVVDGEFGNKVPTGNMQLTANVRKTTIEIKEETHTPVTKEYKVRFTLPDGSPVVGLVAQICTDRNCFPNKVPTDENGWATWERTADNYEIHVPEENWPAGYYFDDAAYKLNATNKTQVTAKFLAYVERTVKVNYAVIEHDDVWDQDVYTPGEAVSGVELKVYEMDTNNYGATDNLIATVTTNAEGVAKFEAKQIDLIVFATPPAGYAINPSDPKMLEKPVGNSAPATLQILLHKAGRDPYMGIKITPSDDAVTVNVTEDVPSLYYEFTPTESGEYTITSTSATLDTYLNLYSANSGFVGTADMRAEEPNDYKKSGNNFTLTLYVGSQYIDGANRWVFRVGAENVTADGSFTFTLKRTGDFDEPETPDVVMVQPQGIIAAADMNEIMSDIDEDSTFTFIKYDADDPYVIVLNNVDHYYHYSTPDGPIVFVTLGDKYTPAGFSDGGFATAIVMSNGIGFAFTDQKTYNDDYKEFVEEYCEANDDGEFVNLNADGLHPLNNELKRFLTLYGESMNREDEYYYACGYYKNRYSQLSGNQVIAANEYKFTVEAGETKALTYNYKNPMMNYDGVISVASGNVKLLNGAGTEVSDLVISCGSEFSIKNEGSATVTVILGVQYKTADENITATGKHLVKASPNGVEYTFTAPEAGNYTFTFNDELYVVEIDENPIYDAVTLTNGQKITIKLYTPFGVNEEEVVPLTIEKVLASA